MKKGVIKKTARETKEVVLRLEQAKLFNCIASL